MKGRLRPPYLILEPTGKVSAFSCRLHRLIYYMYGYRKSHLGRGIVEVPETEIHDIQPEIPGVDEHR